MCCSPRIAVIAHHDRSAISPKRIRQEHCELTVTVRGHSEWQRMRHNSLGLVRDTHSMKAFYTWYRTQLEDVFITFTRLLCAGICRFRLLLFYSISCPGQARIFENDLMLPLNVAKYKQTLEVCDSTRALMQFPSASKELSNGCIVTTIAHENVYGKRKTHVLMLAPSIRCLARIINNINNETKPR